MSGRMWKDVNAASAGLPAQAARAELTVTETIAAPFARS
jgi:hypothetical protein